ncbi:MAG: DUF5110 domain-containing protein, partial [Chryseobacterium sp.]
IRVYEGQDARFDLYEDEGDNYQYEKGKYSVIPFLWNERSRSLEIGNQIGKYPGSLTNRTFKIIFISKSTQVETREKTKMIAYGGRKVIIK